MKFHNNERPGMDEVTMCTVTSYNEQTGFNVTLDEYDLEGLIALVDLNAKKIRGPISSFLKTGEQLPLVVIDPGVDGIVYLSRKDVKADQAKLCCDRYALSCKLFNIVRRLPENLEFEQAFRELNTEDSEEHPWTLLQNREWDKLDLSTEQIQIIESMHAKLFGIKPQSMRAKVSIYSFAYEGNAVVRDLILELQAQSQPQVDGSMSSTRPSEWSDEELYQDTERYNMSIQPVAIPTFQIKITAYNLERCGRALEEIKANLQAKLASGIIDGLQIHETATS